MDTPVLLLIFNRPDLTKIVFDKIAEVKPNVLFVAADGHRPDREGEYEKCQETRRSVLDNVHWDCEVFTLLREKNLGCKRAVSSAIDWFFSIVDKGIILEDDCLPNISFFNFCTELLAHYEYDNQIMHISGNNFQERNTPKRHSYYFSIYNHIWGWATWRRAWQHYDATMEDYDADVVRQVFRYEGEQEYWNKNFTKAALGQIDTWDYQWTYAIWKNSGLAVLPSINLVSNIGFREDATHTNSKDSIIANLPSWTLTQIVHPEVITVDEEADRYTSLKLFRIAKKRFRKRERLKKFVLKKLFHSFIGGNSFLI